MPIAIFLMFLTGVGPLLAWRKASTNSLKRNFLTPALIALAAGVVLYFRGVHHFYAWLSLVMSIFVAITIVREFYKGARARSRRNGRKLRRSGRESHAAQYAAIRRLHRPLRVRAAVYRLVGPGIHDATASSEMGIGDTIADSANTRCAWTSSASRTRRTTRRRRRQ